MGDHSIVYANGHWWVFDGSNGNLYRNDADSLISGQWTQQSSSIFWGVVGGDVRGTCGGRPQAYGDYVDVPLKNASTSRTKRGLTRSTWRGSPNLTRIGRRIIKRNPLRSRLARDQHPRTSGTRGKFITSMWPTFGMETTYMLLMRGIMQAARRTRSGHLSRVGASLFSDALQLVSATKSGEWRRSRQSTTVW